MNDNECQDNTRRERTDNCFFGDNRYVAFSLRGIIYNSVKRS